jgi:hypothetical protein
MSHGDRPVCGLHHWILTAKSLQKSPHGEVLAEKIPQKSPQREVGEEKCAQEITHREVPRRKSLQKCLTANKVLTERKKPYRDEK